MGVILGGIPVVLEAYDRYWTVSKAFRTFRQNEKELIKLDIILKTQKIRFRSNVLKLLTAVTNDPEKAYSLLSGEKPNWKDFDIHGICGKRAENLRDTFTSWKANMGQIQACIETICEEFEIFIPHLTESEKVRHISHKRVASPCAHMTD